MLAFAKYFIMGVMSPVRTLDNNLMVTEDPLVTAHPNSAEYALYAGSDASPVAGCNSTL
jgi:hypothetical protein